MFIIYVVESIIAREKYRRQVERHNLPDSMCHQQNLTPESIFRLNYFIDNKDS